MVTKYLMKSNLKIDIPKKSFPIPWTSPCFFTSGVPWNLWESTSSFTKKCVKNDAKKGWICCLQTAWISYKQNKGKKRPTHISTHRASWQVCKSPSRMLSGVFATRNRSCNGSWVTNFHLPSSILWLQVCILLQIWYRIKSNRKW